MTKDTAKTPKKDAKPKKPNIGQIAMDAIGNGSTNEEALAIVMKAVPDAKTSLSSIGWYRNKMRSDGVKGANGKPIPTAREMKKAVAEKEGGKKAAPKKSGGKKADPTA